MKTYESQRDEIRNFEIINYLIINILYFFMQLCIRYILGAIVSVPIDKLDRAKLDGSRLTGVVVEITEHGYHRIGVTGGVLSVCFLR